MFCNTACHYSIKPHTFVLSEIVLLEVISEIVFVGNKKSDFEFDNLMHDPKAFSNLSEFSCFLVNTA